MNEKEKFELESRLTERQIIFVQEYIKDFNGASAYIRSGYKCSENMARSCASRMLTNVDIQNYLRHIQKEIRLELKIDRNIIINKTMEVLERSMQHRPVLDKSGNPLLIKTPSGELAAAYIFDASNSLKALEFLAKLTGLLDEVEPEERPRINITLKNYLGNSQYVQQIIQEAKDRAAVNH